MPNNYGLGTREMGKAGTFATNAAARAGNLSYSSAATIGERWQQFTRWARSERGIKWMEQVDRQAVEAYGRSLAERVEADARSPAYAQNLVSAVNTVMDLATRGQWESVSPTSACGIPERSRVRDTAPTGYDRAEYDRALDALRSSGLDRQAAIAGLARDLGLRSKEACLLNARAALAEAMKAGQVTITKGTMGGRGKRVIPISSSATQLKALSRATMV
ncbi:MAG: integrase domain-containing protein [Pseudomonadota bacterium]|nr:integrase domain-containing protein [Pseudomonadota bacterium]MDP1904170.1 integrase domain-containing protein [Pseudomonadota bacterium]